MLEHPIELLKCHPEAFHFFNLKGYASFEKPIPWLHLHIREKVSHKMLQRAHTFSMT